jgi:hypothetical protein
MAARLHDDDESVYETGKFERQRWCGHDEKNGVTMNERCSGIIA